MSDDAVTESAKATQEVAKVAGKAIDFAERRCGFISRVFGAPIEDAVAAFVGEPLKRLRMVKTAANQMKLMDDVEALIRQRKLEGKTVSIEPKLGLPIWQHASLESEDSLRSKWAALLVTAIDPERASSVRVAHVSILNELDSLDAKILETLYRKYLDLCEATNDQARFSEWADCSSPVNVAIDSAEIRAVVRVAEDTFERSLDNLFRLRCAASFVETTRMNSISNGVLEIMPISADYLYSKLCITPLGLSLIEACM